MSDAETREGEAPAEPPRRWHFEDARHVDLLIAEAQSWRGTPFVQDSCAKGESGGAYCVSFAEALMLATGAISQPFEIATTRADYNGHVHNDKILRFLRGQDEDPKSAILAARFAELDGIDELIPVASWPNRRVLNTGLLSGDLLIIEARHGVWHMPVMMNDRSFMQCAFPLGVSEGDVTQDDYRDRLRAVFRARAIN